jgi:hypothetical protein
VCSSDLPVAVEELAKGGIRLRPAPETVNGIQKEIDIILDKRRRLCGYLTLTRGEGFGVSEIVVRDDDAARRARRSLRSDPPL